MEKMNMKTANIADRNYEVLSKMFPNAITETIDESGEVVRAIDVEVLQQEISCKIVGGGAEERYQFTWPDKKQAIALANAPISATLRPCREESVNFDSTENLYIEGDNLDVLKLLQETYLGKVKMIYIDPPYNTGNDFIYEDDYSQGRNEYLEYSGQYDDEGNRLVKNLESNGRYHTDWLNMIYPRLKLAKNLLRKDGVIFISIDDNEVENLKKICNEIFGEKNFISIINWKGRGGRQDSKYYAAVHEYILVYAKSSFEFVAGEEIKSGDVYPKYDEAKGKYYKTQLLRKWGSNSRREDRPNLYYPIKAPDGTDVYPIVIVNDNQRPSNKRMFDGRWRHGASTMKKNIEEGNIEFIKNTDNIWIAYEKIYAPDEGEEKTKKYTTWIDEANDGAAQIKSIFESIVFDYPKSINLLLHFFKMANLEEDDILMDFFSGSATTAHAMFRLNAENESKCKFVLIQLPERTDEKNEAFKAGYKNICEIGKERIRRAAKKIKEENPDAEFDSGFRVLKLDSSNMKDVYYNPSDTQQNLMDMLSDNIKEDRTPEDLLFQVMLDLGVMLSSKIDEMEIAGKKVFNVADGFLIACFDKDITEDTVKALAEIKPYYAVFRDSSMANDSVATNFDQIFDRISPETVRKVL